MKRNHAIIILEQALEVAETNEPINRASGNFAQADLELEVADDISAALDILNSTPNPMGRYLKAVREAVLAKTAK